MFDAARLVFIDETSANTKMMRLHGRCVRGERLVDHVPQGHWKTITSVAALRRHGMRASRTIDGSMTGKKFLAYVERCLAPTLKRKDIVMIDTVVRLGRNAASPYSLPAPQLLGFPPSPACKGPRRPYWSQSAINYRQFRFPRLHSFILPSPTPRPSPAPDDDFPPSM